MQELAHVQNAQLWQRVHQLSQRQAALRWAAGHALLRPTVPYGHLLAG
jgi:hypothetical protein